MKDYSIEELQGMVESVEFVRSTYDLPSSMYPGVTEEKLSNVEQTIHFEIVNRAVAFSDKINKQ